MTSIQQSSNVALDRAFAERAQAMGATVSTAQSPEQAAEIIAAGTDLPTLTGRYTATRALVEAYPPLVRALQERGIELRVVDDIAPSEAIPTEFAAAMAGDVGIILARAGVAETGSFLSVEETLPGRLLGMLSDSVFALLPEDSIVPTLDEMGQLLSRLTREGMRYLSLVTGPSRTADIERVLTIGVQGPKALHVILLGGDGSSGNDSKVEGK